MVVRDFHFLRLCRLAALVVVVESLGQGKRLVLILAQVLHLGQPAAVAGLVVNEECEGARAVALVFEPVDGLVGDDVRHVALLPHRVVLHGDEVRVVVVPLFGQDVPVVEARG